MYRALISLCLFFGLVSPTLADDKEIIILAMGDSLTAGYGLDAGDGFTDQLEDWLNAQLENKTVRVVNAGVSGDTSRGGASRFEWILAGEKPDIVMIEFGGNDGLRGIDPALTRTSIDAMVKTAHEQDITVLLAGMQAPANLGPDYGEDFNSIFPDVAAKYDVLLYPFFLEGVALVKELNQDDVIHPNKEGVAVIVENIGPYFLKLIN